MRLNGICDLSCAATAAWPTVIETLNRAKILIRLRQGPLLGLIVNPLGKTAKVLELGDDTLRATKRGQTAHLSLADVCDSPAVRKGAFSSTVTVRSSTQADIILRGANHSEAVEFADQLKCAWIDVNLTALKREADRFDRLHAAISALAIPAQYPAACIIEPLLLDARDLDGALLSKLQREAIGVEGMARVDRVRKFVSGPRAVRAEAVSMFVAAELERWKEFFDTVESMPLTPEQRLSVVVDEDATLVLAGAGSGKTSVITAKAAYLVKAGIRRPEEILLLAFAKNAAEEMSERVEARSAS
jgi:DNA helicase IV